MRSPGRLAFVATAGVVVVATVTAPTQAAQPTGDDRRTQVVQKPYERVDRGVGAGERFQIYDPSVGESEQWYINDHTFVKGPDGTWHMFGITHEEPADPLDETYFAHATAGSLTQKQWVKQEPVMHADVDSGETHVWAPYVIEHDGTYYMYYAGGTDDHERYRMQLATSKDLFHWKRHPENPLFTDGYDARDPMVRRMGNRWVMYYTANSRPDGGNHIVAYRTSRDLVNWSKRSVAMKHPVKGTFGGPTESPYVVQDGDDYYLTTCCTSYYTDTRVFHSKDPLHFDVDDEIGQIDEHASEVVRDGDDLYVSGAGWGQGGLYLRPLDLNQKRVTKGRIVRSKRYRLDLQTSPHTSVRSMDVRAPRGWRRVLDDDFGGTGPYLAVGNFGNTDPAGEADRVVAGDRGRRLSLRGVGLGDEPARVDWTFRFAPQHFDMSATWHVDGQPNAPVWETAMPFDTALPRVGDDQVADRETGDVPGFSRYALASSKRATVAAAYLDDSAWRSDNRFINKPVGAFVWQSLWKQGGEELAPSTYTGGTWRVGGSARGHDRSLGERLHRSLNTRRAYDR